MEMVSSTEQVLLTQTQAIRGDRRSMTTDATKFVCAGGLSYPVAIELAAQIDAAEPSAEKLVSAFIPDFLARELATQIKSGAGNAVRLQEVYFVAPELASAIATAINARNQ